MDLDGSGLPLLIWFSPAFPVGAFAYSHGLEWAVESGAVKDAAGLQHWLGVLLQHGGARNDAIIFANVWRLTSSPDGEEETRRPHAIAKSHKALSDINSLALALAGSRERLLETTSQGNAFVTAARAAWPCAALDAGVLPAGDIVYPVASARACAGHGIALGPALQAFTLGSVSNLVSAAVRLGPIGQTDGQRVLAALLPQVRALAMEAQDATLDDLGGCAFISDIAAMQHETQYSRLFRS
jgi:urease accessory protein